MNAINTHLTGESVHEYGDTDGQRAVIWGILLQAFTDATYDGPVKAQQDAQRDAHIWISRCHPWFRRYCDVLGMDADFLSEAYNAGRVDPALLRSADPARTAPGFERGDLIAAVLSALQGEMTTREVTEAIRAQGHDVTDNQISNSLRQAAAKKEPLISRRKEKNLAVWSKIGENA